MRTLFISPYVPEPLNTGANQRIFHLLRAIARISEVTFVSATPGGKWNDSTAAFHSLCKDEFFFHKESREGEESHLPRPVRWANTIRRHFGTSEPVLLQRFKSPEAVDILQKLSARSFDLVWVERIFMFGLLPKGLKTRIVVDLDDLEHQRLRRELKITRLNKRVLFDYWEYLKLRRFERGLPKRLCEFVVCSETDKRILGGGARIWVVPNGVEIPACADGSAMDPSDPVLAFIGYMAYDPNVDAAQFFAREIFPLIRREVPATKLLIVGRDPTPAVRELADDKTIFVTGTVPDIEPYLRQSRVVVVPLRVGGGTRIKILEAMAYRRPVVSTSIGAQGLDLESGRHLLIADSPSRFAEACVLLLRDHNRRRELAAAAFDFVRRKHEWSKIESWVERIAAGDALVQPQPAVIGAQSV